MKNKDEIMTELKRLETEENINLFKSYFEALLDGNIEKAVEITMTTTMLIPADVMAHIMLVMEKVSDKISDYYFDHMDEDDEFCKRNDEILDLYEKLQKGEED